MNASAKLASVVEQLELAKLVTRVMHTHASGIPLGSDTKSRDFRILFLDVGLLCRACRLDMTEILGAEDLLMVNSGAICEQFIGQHLLHNVPSYQQPELYCWMRQKAGTSSEVDYVIQHGTRIIPVEVKAGVTGRLKSLHVFVLENNGILRYVSTRILPRLSIRSRRWRLGNQGRSGCFPCPFTWSARPID